LQARIGGVAFSVSRVFKLWAAALTAAALSLLLEWRLHLGSHPILRGLVVLIPFGVAYLAITHLLGLDEAVPSIFARFRPKRR
jgi:hypothetical protein